MFDKKAPVALMYDFDDVINNPRGENPKPGSDYIIDKDGNMGGTIIGIEKLKKIIDFCISNNIPLYLITARPERHRDFVMQQIERIGGINNEGIGGFKIDNIHCLGREIYSESLKRPHVEGLIVKDKLTKIQEIHQNELKHLPRNRILFIDDDLARNIEPAKKDGYSTILAHIGNDEHHEKALCFLQAAVHMPMLTTQGNYAVLTEAEKLNSTEVFKLDKNEFFELATEPGLEGQYWRKRLVPDLNKLIEITPFPERDLRAKELDLLGFEQSIFFTNNIDIIKTHIINNSYGTISCIDELATKKLIILIGSLGSRKIAPLTRALQKALPRLFASTAIIGLPAESQVPSQPVGHEEIILGCKNRLNQVRYFEQGLQLVLNSLQGNKRQNIVSIAIENGIGLFPVDEVSNDGLLHLSAMPITSSEDGLLYHFYDQAAIYYHFSDKTHLNFTKPTRINYKLVSKVLHELEGYFVEGKPTNRYYLMQSQWSNEMLRILKSENPNSAYPYRYENDNSQPLSSDHLIQLVLSELFESTLKDLVSASLENTPNFFRNRKITTDSIANIEEKEEANDNEFSL